MDLCQKLTNQPTLSFLVRSTKPKQTSFGIDTWEKFLIVLLESTPWYFMLLDSIHLQLIRTGKEPTYGPSDITELAGLEEVC